jgi:hypothetical protein
MFVARIGFRLAACPAQLNNASFGECWIFVEDETDAELR